MTCASANKIVSSVVGVRMLRLCDSFESAPEYDPDSRSSADNSDSSVEDGHALAEDNNNLVSVQRFAFCVQLASKVRVSSLSLGPLPSF